MMPCRETAMLCEPGDRTPGSSNIEVERPARLNRRYAVADVIALAKGLTDRLHSVPTKSQLLSAHLSLGWEDSLRQVSLILERPARSNGRCATLDVVGFAGRLPA